MIGKVGRANKNVFDGYGRPFELKWLKLHDLDFGELANIRNPWNEDKPVKVSRDGQELPFDIGKFLCELVDHQVYKGDPEGYVDDSTEDPHEPGRSRDVRGGAL